VIAKTDRLRSMEAEARRKRQDDANGSEERKFGLPPRSALPPMQDRKKAAQKADVFEIVEAAPAAGSGGGAA
jgi:hypothetical protein